MYLQLTGGESKSMSVPLQSFSFRWNPQVACLFGQSGTIHILSEAELALPDEIEVQFVVLTLYISITTLLTLVVG